jgi:hypothetical protein
VENFWEVSLKIKKGIKNKIKMRNNMLFYEGNHNPKCDE